MKSIESHITRQSYLPLLHSIDGSRYIYLKMFYTNKGLNTVLRGVTWGDFLHVSTRLHSEKQQKNKENVRRCRVGLYKAYNLSQERRAWPSLLPIKMGNSTQAAYVQQALHREKTQGGSTRRALEGLVHLEDN